MKSLFFLWLLGLSTFAFGQVSDERYLHLVERLVKVSLSLEKQYAAVEASYKAKVPLTGEQIESISEYAKEHLTCFEAAKEYIHSNTQDLETTAVGMTLFDTSLYTRDLMIKLRKFRVTLNGGDAAFEIRINEFSRLVRKAFSRKMRLFLDRGASLYKAETGTNASKFSTAREIIAKSFFYSNFGAEVKNRKLKQAIFYFEKKSVTEIKLDADVLIRLGNDIFNQGSGLFGNTMGRFQERKGFLYKDKNFEAVVNSKIRPLDLLLEKTPFRLTDRLIPGFWGHVAIYIGDEAYLKRLGIWNHPLVHKHKASIKDGKLIVEALREGVQINSLEHFTDIDDFALIRLRRTLSKEEQRAHILRALAQIGKKYDFNFDVEDGERIVCSELPYRTFIGVEFKTKLILGRSTIDVDQVAEEAMEHGPFYPVILYTDGQRVTDDIQKTFDELLTMAEVD